MSVPFFRKSRPNLDRPTCDQTPHLEIILLCYLCPTLDCIGFGFPEFCYPRFGDELFLLLLFRSVPSPSTLFRQHKVSIGAALCTVLAFFSGATCPTAHAQTAHLSGVQITLPFTGLNNPRQVAVDSSGNIYIADSSNNRVLKETLSGGSYTQTTIGTSLKSPLGVAVDAAGNVYIADSDNGRLLKETQSGGSYTESTISSDVGSAFSVAVDLSGNVFVADPSSNQVLKETPLGSSYVESTIGSGLSDPDAVAVDGSGNLYIADQGSNQVFKETLSGGSYTQSTLASGLSYISSVAVDESGNVYIAVYGVPSDAEGSQILKETLSGGSYTQSIVGSNPYYKVVPLYIAADSSGDIFIDYYNGMEELKASAPDFGEVSVGSPGSTISLIVTLDTAGTIAKPAVLTQGATGLDFTDAGTGSCTTTASSVLYAAGQTCTVDVIFKPKAVGLRYGAAVLNDASGTPILIGYVQGTGLGPQVNFLPGLQSTLALSNATSPYAMAQDAAGNLYIAEAVGAYSPQNAVVKETWTGSGYTQSTVVSGLGYPVGVAVDGAGNVFIADQAAGEVLKETPLSGGGYTQTALFSALGSVEAVAVDGSGNVYISTLAYGLLKETLTAGSYTQSTINGNVYAFGIAVDGQGDIFLGDSVNNQILKESLVNSNYTQSTVATGLNGPHGVAVDGSGNLYIANTQGGQIVKATLSGGNYTQSTLASGLNDPLGIAVDWNGNVFASSAAANTAWKLGFSDPPSLSFATTPVGSTSSDSPRIVTIQNVGNAVLSFPVPGTGNNPSIAPNFALDSSGSSNCPLVNTSSSTVTTLAAGASCLLPISFRPGAIGTLSGSLVVTDNNLNAAAPGYATQSIQLSGTGIQGTPAITWLSPATISYGTPLSATQLNASSTAAGTFVYSPAIGSVLNAGSQTLSATFTPTDTTDYTMASATTSIIVAKATPVLAFAPIATQSYGAAPVAVTASSASSGTIVYSVVSGPVTVSGNMVTITGAGTVVLSATQAATANYTAATTSTSFAVVAPFKVTSGASTSATVASAGTATYSLMLTPGAGGFADDISLSATGLPSGATATFSPATIKAGSGATSVTLTIQTSRQTARSELPFSDAQLPPLSLGFFLLPLLGVKPLRRRVPHITRLRMVLSAVALSLGVMLSLSGCSGGSSQTSTQAAQSYTVVVTAKDATTGLQSSVDLTLIMQ